MDSFEEYETLLGNIPLFARNFTSKSNFGCHPVFLARFPPHFKPSFNKERDNIKIGKNGH